MSSYREQSRHHKKVQTGIVDAKPLTAKPKKARPVVLELFCTWTWKKEPPAWEKRGSYIKPEDAHAAAKQLLRKQHLLYDKTKYRVNGVEFQTDLVAQANK